MAVRVLLIDDNPEFRAQAEGFVASLPGVDLAGTAASGPAGLLQLETARPDLVLLDLHMPGGGGFEFLRQVASRPALRVVVVSLDDREECQALAFSLGAAGFLAKSRFAGSLEALIGALFPGAAR